MTETTDLFRLESKVDALTGAINRLVLFEERQAVQALAIIENSKMTKEVSEKLAFRIEQVDSKVSTRVELLEIKLAMWINRGIGVWALAVTLFTVYKAVAP